MPRRSVRSFDGVLRRYTMSVSHGPFDLWSLLVAPGRDLSPSTHETPEGARILAVRVHQADDHVDGVEFRYRQPSPSDVPPWFGAHGRSGKKTTPVTLTLEDDEDIVSVKVTFANERLWARSLVFTTSTGRVVDSGEARRPRWAPLIASANVPSVVLENGGAPLSGVKVEVFLRDEDIPDCPAPIPCLTQTTTFKFRVRHASEL